MDIDAEDGVNYLGAEQGGLPSSREQNALAALFMEAIEFPHCLRRAAANPSSSITAAYLTSVFSPEQTHICGC